MSPASTDAGFDRRRHRRTPVTRPSPFVGLAVTNVDFGAWLSVPFGAVLRGIAAGSGDQPEPDHAYPAAGSVGLGPSVAALAMLAGRPQAAHLTAGLDGAGPFLIEGLARWTGHGTPGRQYNSATVRRKTAVERS